MSILRGVKELGLGADHFLITGNDIPSDWADPTPKEIYFRERDEENRLSTLDTKKGWFKRRRFIGSHIQPIGFLGERGYYHIDQTISLDMYKDKVLEYIKNDLERFVEQIELDGLSTESKLDEQFKYLKKSISGSLDFRYRSLKSGVSFDSEPVPIRNNRSDVDDDIPL